MSSHRRKLPSERPSLTHDFTIGGVEGYITVGLYDDGDPGEIFVKMDRQGSQVSGFVDAWAISVSLLLQMGMPLSEICRKFRGCRFEPDGFTNNPNIKIALSPIDYIARWLEGRFVISEQYLLELDAKVEAKPDEKTDEVPMHTPKDPLPPGPTSVEEAHRRAGVPLPAKHEEEE